MKHLKILGILLCLLFLGLSAACGHTALKGDESRSCGASSELRPLRAHSSSAYAVGVSGEHERKNGIPMTVIMYHMVCPGKSSRYVIPPRVLEDDLKYLNSNGYEAVTVADLIRFQQNDVPLPEKPVMITFDDGNRTNYTYAYPLLKKYGQKAIMAVVGAFIDKGYHNDGSDRAIDFMLWNIKAFTAVNCHERRIDYEATLCRRALELLSKDIWKFKGATTHIYGMDEFDKANDDLNTKRGNYIKGAVACG